MSEVKWKEVESSNIDAIGYNEENQELHIRFKSSAEYVYTDVPASVYQGFLDADSKGRYLNTVIKGKYNTMRV